MVGTNISNYLQEKGIKQNYLADKIGCPQSRLSRILNNISKIDCVTYYKICKALDVEMERFMEEE